MIRKLLGCAALVLVLLYAVNNPSATAATLHRIGAGAARLVSALVGGEH